MPPTVSASRPKQALVRFLNASRQPIGTGCLTIDGLIVTCAHVVRDAFGLTQEQAMGALPRGVLTFDFPFLDSDEPQPVPEAGSKQLYRAEVTHGGWGWMNRRLLRDEKELHKNDIAILKLIGEPPFAYGRMFRETYAGEQDLQLWLRGFPNNDPHAGPVNATLKAQSELYKGLLTLDFEKSLYILNPGCSGAPVFLPDGNAAIGMFIGRPSHLKESHRDEKRIFYAVPAKQINALLNAAKQAQPPDDTPEEIAKIRSIIPSLQNHLQTVSREANDPRIFCGMSVCLDDMEAALEDGFEESVIPDFAEYIGAFDDFHHEARTEGLDYRLGIGAFDDMRQSLDDFKEKCHPVAPTKTIPPAIGNCWSNAKLPHRDERDALLEKIEARLQSLRMHSSRIGPLAQSSAGNLALKQTPQDENLLPLLSPEARKKASKILRELRRELHKDPVRLSIINKVRAKLEALERSLFQELIVLCQVFLGRHAKILPAKAVFRDFPDGPEMVVIPAERFMMGSPEDEPERSDREGPQHEVTIAKKFAMGRFAVSFDEWLFAVRNGGCDGYEPDDGGWGREDRPVINVSWDDAQNYVRWLSKRTGKDYRLPSEAEWEYAARAGTSGPFSFEGKITTDKANYDGNYSYDDSPEGEYRKKTLPVRSFEPNKFGLYQVHGNVWEWCEDDWHESYKDKPEELKANGGAWRSDEENRLRVFRGGSWNLYPRNLRSACRASGSSQSSGATHLRFPALEDVKS